MIVVEFIPPSIFLRSLSRREKFSSQSIKINTVSFFWLLFKCQAYLIFLSFLRKLKPNWELLWNILKKMNTILRQTLTCVSRCAVFTKPEGKTQLWVLKHQTDYWQPVRARKETPARRPSAAVLLLPPSDQIQVCSILFWFYLFFWEGVYR